MMNDPTPPPAETSPGNDAVDVTVLIPAYRPSRWINRILASLAQQTDIGFKLIISIDHADASDRTLVEACVARYLPRHDVIIKTQSQPCGWVGNYNILLALAKTRYVCLIPQDDYIAPSYLSALRTAHEKNPSAAVTYPDVYYEGVAHRRWTFAMRALFTPQRRGLRERWNTARERWREGIVFRSPSSQGSRATRVREYLEHSHLPAAVRGLIDTQVMGPHLLLRHGCDDDFNADIVWVLAMVDRGPAIRVPQARFHKVMHSKNTHVGWARRNREEAHKRWLNHCWDCREQLTALGWKWGPHKPVVRWLLRRFRSSATLMWPHYPLPPQTKTESRLVAEKLLRSPSGTETSQTFQ
ncbi:MAG: hypothetical protein SynsKO_30880 [Synoicihabitans sp.]